MRLLLVAFSFLMISQAAFAETYRRLVNFEWETIDGAVSYEIEIKQTNKKDAKPYTFKVKDAAWNGRLPPGKYVMKLRSMDARGVPGDWSEPSDFDVNLENVVLRQPAANASLTTKEEKEDEIKFQWDAVNGADSYVIEVKSDDGKFVKTEEIDKINYSLDLPVGQQYTWKVSAKSKTGMGSDAVSVGQFGILGAKLEKPKIEKPESQFVREVKWNKPDHTDKFDVVIAKYNAKDKKWENVKTIKDHEDTKVDFDEKWSGGIYRMAVVAKGNLRQPSDVSQVSFKVKEGNRSPAAEYTALVRESIDRVTGWYGIASYLITQVNYTSIYQETATALSFSAIGGTGRLGLGWFSGVSPWGFLGILDLSGFTYQGQTSTYASLELSSVWRTKAGDRGEIRLQGGGYYKELPGMTGNILLQTSETNQIATVGPHGGAEFWYSMTPKFGMQVNAHVYLSMLKMKTPNGQDLEPTMSTQFGFLGSYRVSSKFTGLMGYARREDKIKYKAGESSLVSVPSGSSNESIVTGDYLNFFAEYAF
jgi:hypothetical protein